MLRCQDLRGLFSIMFQIIESSLTLHRNPSTRDSALVRKAEELDWLHGSPLEFVLGGSWVVISGVISRVTILVTHIGGLITPLITTHKPPSRRVRLRLS